MHVFVHMTTVPSEARGWCWDPCSWSYRQLWATQHRYWELKSGFFFVRAVLAVNHEPSLLTSMSSCMTLLLVMWLRPAHSGLPSRFLTSLSPQCAGSLLKTSTLGKDRLCWLAWSKRTSENWESSRFYFVGTNYSWIPGVTARISDLGTITRQGDTFHPAENLPTNTHSTRGAGR